MNTTSEDAVPHPRIPVETSSNWLTKNVHSLVVKHLQYFKHDEKLLDNYRRLTLASQSPESFYLRLTLFNGGGFELLAEPSPGKGEVLSPGIRRWYWMPEQATSPELALLAIEYRSGLVKIIRSLYAKCFCKDKRLKMGQEEFVSVTDGFVVWPSKQLSDLVCETLLVHPESICIELDSLYLSVNGKKYRTGMVPKVTGKNAANFK